MDNIEAQERIEIEKGKHLTVQRHIVRKSYPIHLHSFFEIEIILFGEGKIRLNDDVFDIKEYNVFFLTPTDFHSVEVEKHTEILNISFDEKIISESALRKLMFTKTRKSYSLSPDEYKRIANAAEILKHEYEINGSSQKALLEYVIKCLLRKNNYSELYLSDDKHSGAIERALTYIELHFREDITLSKTAREIGYNPTYFSELFKLATGEGYVEYLTRMRINYAKTLLSGGFSVSEACFGSGFGSLSNFFEVFKRHVGVTPKEYRKKKL